MALTKAFFVAEHMAHRHISSAMQMSHRAFELKKLGRPIISLSAGQPHFPPPDFISKILSEAAQQPDVYRYPPPAGLLDLRKAMAARWQEQFKRNVSEDEVIISAGARQALSVLFESVIDEGDDVILPAPHWNGFFQLLLRTRASIKIVKTDSKNNWKLTPNLLQSTLSERTALVVLSNPVNPTGAVYSADELRNLASVLTERVPTALLVVDEVYGSLLFEGAPFVTAGQVIHQTPIAIVSGWSKSYSLMGLRLGCTFAPASVISAMEVLQAEITYPLALAQHAALASFGDRDKFPQWMSRSYEANFRAILPYLKKLKKFGWSLATEPKGGVFLFLRGEDFFRQHSQFANADAVSSWLLEIAGVAVVSGAEFGDPHSLRVGLCVDREQLLLAYDRILDAFQQLDR